MLQFDALRPDTLDVLNLTMAEPLLNDFVLVGGTALALHYGHRISEDIDLFVWERFNVDVLVLELTQKHPFTVKIKTPIGVHLFYEGVKTDLVYFPSKPMRDIIVQDGVRLLHTDDIAAMKLNAIANRGARKDFYDLYFLLEKYSIKELMGLFSERFKTHDLFGLSRSLTYFADADLQADVMLLKSKNLAWEQIKNHITEEVRSSLF